MLIVASSAILLMAALGHFETINKTEINRRLDESIPPDF